MRNRDELIRSFKDYSGQSIIWIESGSLTDVPRSLSDWLNDPKHCLVGVKSQHQDEASS